MKKHNKKMILDYIWGNEISEYEIEKLENDYEFMMEVIKHTKDKNIYHLCSDKVKNNYLFVRFMVETFINDIKFVTSIADEYLKKFSIDDIVARELTVLISEHITQEQAEDNLHLFLYKATASGYYELERSSFFHLIEKIDDEEIKEDYGLGFLYYFDKYSTSKILCDFFAKKVIDDIFYENNKYSLEELFHKEFKSLEELESYGINNFLLEYIEQFDGYLSDYLSENIELLNVLDKQIIRIKKNWHNYVERINEQKVTIYNQELSMYMDDTLSSISTLELTMYSIKKLNLEDIFYKYDPFLKEFNEGDKIDINKINTEQNLNINDYRCIKYALNLAEDLFSNDIIETKISEYQTKIIDKNTKCKLLKVDFKNRCIKS